MNHKMGKIFWKNTEGKRTLSFIDYDPKIEHEYYEFVKKYHLDGFHQVILNSEVILKLTSYYFLNRGMSISEVLFLEDDETLSSRIDGLISKCSFERGYFTKILEELKFVHEESAIDIKRISLINKTGSNMPYSIFFQVNGIIGIDELSYENEKSTVSQTIQALTFNE